MAHGVLKALGTLAILVAGGKVGAFSRDNREWMVGFSAAFLGLNKHRFGYFTVTATRAEPWRSPA